MGRGWVHVTCLAPFGELDVSVDLVATSQYAVSLTLDHIPGGVHGDVYQRLIARLESLVLCRLESPAQWCLLLRKFACST